MSDSVSKNIYITGSNSKLLSKEIATSLRGRTLVYELLPLSFKEFLNFKQTRVDLFSAPSQAALVSGFQDYLNQGGFPRAVLNSSSLERTSLLQGYFNVMIQKDIIDRYNVNNDQALKYFCRHLLQNHASSFSIHKIYNAAKSAGLKVSLASFYDFFEYVQNIYLANVLKKYEPSLRTQDQSEKKVYAIDNGLFNSVSLRTSPNTGKLLEGAVFNYLLQKYEADNLSFFKEATFECDFLVRHGVVVTQAIQATIDMSDESARKRELRGIIKTCQKFNLKSAKIITLDTEETITQGDLNIEVIPAWRYFLE